MRLLLDTHIFLWYVGNDARLSKPTAAAIRNPDSHVYLSSVSIWECLVKSRLGKLPLPESPEIYLPRQRERHAISSLPLDEPSVCRLSSLPDLHRDPFDRMLICQALAHDLTLVTVDQAMQGYAVPRL